MSLRNIPMMQAFTLEDAISNRPGQVSSMGLATPGSACDIILISFAEGESVSEEAYLADVLYLAVQGNPTIVLPDARIVLQPGQACAIPSGVLHAVESQGSFKILQLAIS